MNKVPRPAQFTLIVNEPQLKLVQLALQSYSITLAVAHELAEEEGKASVVTEVRAHRHELARIIDHVGRATK
jgi:hypothetical protein